MKDKENLTVVVRVFLKQVEHTSGAGGWSLVAPW